MPCLQLTKCGTACNIGLCPLLELFKRRLYKPHNSYIDDDNDNDNDNNNNNNNNNSNNNNNNSDNNNNNNNNNNSDNNNNNSSDNNNNNSSDNNNNNSDNNNNKKKKKKNNKNKNIMLLLLLLLLLLRLLLLLLLLLEGFQRCSNDCLFLKQVEKSAVRYFGLLALACYHFSGCLLCRGVGAFLQGNHPWRSLKPLRREALLFTESPKVMEGGLDCQL